MESFETGRGRGSMGAASFRGALEALGGLMEPSLPPVSRLLAPRERLGSLAHGPKNSNGTSCDSCFPSSALLHRVVDELAACELCLITPDKRP
jgi:hypothetical protein